MARRLKFDGCVVDVWRVGKTGHDLSGKLGQVNVGQVRTGQIMEDISRKSPHPSDLYWEKFEM